MTGPVVTPEAFGANGDDSVDDSVALQRALDALKAGETLQLAAGKVYRHSQTLRISQAGTSVTGPGTLLATNEATSAVFIDADNVTVSNVTIKLASSTQRWVAYEQMGLVLRAKTGIAVRNVTVEGSAAAGIYVGGSKDFTLTDVTVRDTRADGIHMTEGATNGQVVRPTVVRSGDDGVAVVSYRTNSTPTSRITISDATVRDQVWGRAYSVVGGQQVTMTNISSTNSAGAALYIASETEFDTMGVSTVVVDGATFTGSNQQAASVASLRPSPSSGRVVHGAVLLYNSQAANQISDVSLRNITIVDTDPEAYDHVKVMSYNNEVQQRLSFEGFTISGGYASAMQTLGVPSSSYNKRNWSLNGTPQADQIGW